MLEIKDLNLAYGQSRVVRDVSFTCAPGETVAVMGRNGMGKTTLMKGMMGIVKRESGSVIVGGQDISTFDSYKRVKAGIAYVPQGRQIFSSLTVEENIKTGLEVVKDKRIPEYIYQMFPILKEFRARKGGNLSGGQQQQLAIARALVSNPKVLILDEPTEGIQPSIIKEIAQTLNVIKQERGLAIVVSEQVLSFALEVADRLLVIEGGILVHQEKRADVDEAKVAKYLSV
jgi:urea transport system ATP-binding protein